MEPEVRSNGKTCMKLANHVTVLGTLALPGAVLLKKSIRNVDVRCARRIAASPGVGPIQSRIEAQEPDALLEAGVHRRVGRLLPSEGLLREGDGSGADKGPRPQRSILSERE